MGVLIMIRDCIKNIIFNSLNYDIFRYEDFKINEANGYNSEISICYNDYYYKMEFKYNDCNMVFSPGEILMKETSNLELSSFEYHISSEIRKWLDRIKREMLNPIEKRFIDDSIQTFREEMESKLSEMEDGYFTNEEGDELRERLEKLEKIILDKESQEEIQSEITKMKNEIEFLKATISTLTKKKWFKNAIIKIWTWGQKEENRKLIETGVEVVKSISPIDIPKI